MSHHLTCSSTQWLIFQETPFGLWSSKRVRKRQQLQVAGRHLRASTRCDRGMDPENYATASHILHRSSVPILGLLMQAGKYLRSALRVPTLWAMCVQLCIHSQLHMLCFKLSVRTYRYPKVLTPLLNLWSSALLQTPLLM
jgi:hypothetical protein